MTGPGAHLQRELLRLLRPLDRRRARLPSERAQPGLAEVGRTHAGRAPDEIVAALEAVVRSVGAEPDRAALEEFAAQIAAGENPFE